MSTLSTGAGNAWAMVVMLISLPVLLNELGPAVFGTWVLLQTFSAVTGWLSVADLGVGTSATRLVAEHRSLADGERVGLAIGSSMAVFVVLGALSSVALAAIGPSALPALFGTPDEVRAALQTAILYFAVQAFADLVTEGTESCIEGLQRVEVSRAVDALRRTLVAGATITAASSGRGLEGVALASMLASAAGTVVALVVLMRLARGTPFRVGWGDIAWLLRAGRAVMLLRPLGVLRRTMDRLIVGVAIGPEAVALVEIAAQVQAGAEAALSASSYAVVPSAAWLRARSDAHTLRELLLTGTKYSLLVALPMAGAAAALAGPIVEAWVGRPYSDAAGLVPLALAYVVLVAPLQVGSNLLLGVGRTTPLLVAACLSLAVNFGASLLLVNAVGTVGTFQGALIGGAVLIAPLAWAMLSEAGVPAGEFMKGAVAPAIPPLFALGAVVTIALALPLGPLATVVLGGGVGAVAYAAGVARFSLAPGELRGLGTTLFGGG